jgi:hypothetical protein
LTGSQPNLKTDFSWAVLSDQARATKTSLTAVADSGATRPEKHTREFYSELETMSVSSISTVLTSATDKLKKIKIDSMAKSKQFVPMLDSESKIVVLPSSLKDDTTGLGPTLIRFASFFKFEIKIFENEVDPSKAPVIDNTISDCFFQSLDDVVNSVNVVGEKKNMRERVRGFVRAQQIMGFVASRKQGPEILKRHHSYFGNNPTETQSVEVAANKFQSIKIDYFKDRIYGMWNEVNFKNQLTEILMWFIRNSWRAVDAKILYDNTVKALLPYEEVVKLYCSKPEVEETGKGKSKKVETHHRVPSKPKENAMLLKAEQLILNELNQTLFGKTYYEEHLEEWPELLLGSGLRLIKEDLVDLYKARGLYVTAFGRLTTQRLNQVRQQVLTERKTRQKKDVTSAEVATLILMRKDSIGMFADEVLQMDPQLNHFLGVTLSGLRRTAVYSTMPDTTAVRTYLIDLCIQRKLYHDLTRTAEQAKAWTVYYGEETSKTAAQQQMIEAFKTYCRTQSKARVPYKKRNYTLAHLIEDQLRGIKKSEPKPEPKGKGKVRQETEKVASTSQVAPPSDELLSEVAAQAATVQAIKADDRPRKFEPITREDFKYIFELGMSDDPLKQGFFKILTEQAMLVHKGTKLGQDFEDPKQIVEAFAFITYAQAAKTRGLGPTDELVADLVDYSINTAIDSWNNYDAPEGAPGFFLLK